MILLIRDGFVWLQKIYIFIGYFNLLFNMPFDFATNVVKYCLLIFSEFSNMIISVIEKLYFS